MVGPESNRVFYLQKNTIRTIFKLKPTVSFRDVLKCNNLITFPCIYMLPIEILLLIFYANFNSIFNNQIHSHDTRSRYDFRVDFVSSQRGANNPLYCVAEFFNRLPATINEQLSKMTFMQQWSIKSSITE